MLILRDNDLVIGPGRIIFLLVIDLVMGLLDTIVLLLDSLVIDRVTGL
jgi:hypothetical protein